MKALTIWQPFAGLIMSGVKPVENRPWRPGLAPGDRFAIHAGKDCDVEPWVEEEIKKLGRGWWDNGVILGTVRFMGIITKAEELPIGDRRWFVGPVGWLVDMPQEWNLPPAIKGKLGLWDVPPGIGKLPAPGSFR